MMFDLLMLATLQLQLLAAATCYLMLLATPVARVRLARAIRKQ